jgi:hypothetical protein
MLRWRIPSLLLVSVAVAACSTVRYSADYDQQASFAHFATYGWIAPTDDEQAALERINPFLERRLQRAVDRELADRGFEASTSSDPDFLVSVYPVVARVSQASAGTATAQPYGLNRPSRVHVSVGFGVGFGHPYGFGLPYWHGFGYPYGFGFGYPYGFGFGYPYGFGFGYPYGSGFGYPFGFAYRGYRYPYYGYRPYGFRPAFFVGYSSPIGRGYAPMGAAGGLTVGTIVLDVIDARTDELVWRGWAEGALFEAPRSDQLAQYADEVVGKILEGFPPSFQSR